MQKKWVMTLVLYLLSALSLSIGALALPDIFEPDNNSTNATFIPTNGAAQTHNFSSSTDVDYIKFNTTAGLVYFIQALNITPASTTDTVLTLYDTDGVTQLVQHDDVEAGVVRFSQIAWKASTTGTYFAKVNEFSGNVDGNYQISIQEHGYLAPFLITPSTATNVSKNRLFNFSAGVQCVGGPCLAIRATLDPIEAPSAQLLFSNAERVDKRLFALLENSSKVPVIIKLRDDDIVKGENAFIQAKAKPRFTKGKKILRAAKDAGVSKQELQELRKSLIKSDQEEVLELLDVRRLSLQEFVKQQEERIEREAREDRNVTTTDETMARSSSETKDSALVSDFDLKFQYSTVNELAGDISQAGLKKLLENADVEYVYLDGEVHAMLDQSVPLINGDDVRSLVVANYINGTGQTVCILDTGINFTHPDFGTCNFTNNINDRSCPKVVGGYDFVNGDDNPTDDNSHGSHVAGIVASEDATYKGVAPGAKLVAIKVLNAAGSGSFSSVIAGVDWCVNNASKLNISVITMSLGDSSRQSATCNAHSSGPAILNAVANNILVSIASGNDGYGNSGSNTAGISAPACVSNATSVGASSKADAITSYSNRGLILDLLAPGGVSGASIIATSHTGGHTGKLGTSMATPHVAGAAALIQQFYHEKFNQNASPVLIEHALKFNGVSLADSGTGIAFTRIDALDATTSKGDVSMISGATPFYTLSQNPSNATCLLNLSVNATCNQTWIVNATGDFTNYEFFVIYETEYRQNTTSRINISIVNHAPLLTMGAVSPGSGNLSTLFNFTVNYTDIDNETPSYVNVTLLAGTFSMVASNASDSDVVDGKIFFVNRTVSKGNNTFFFRASDGFNVTVTLNQSGPNITNSPPQLNGSNLVPNVSWPEDTVNTSLNLSRHFFDLDGDDLNFSATPVSNIVIAVNNDTGIVTLTPAGNFTGTRTVNFTATDGLNATQSNEVTLNVTPVNDAPSLNASQAVQNLTWPQDTSNTTLNISQNFFDVDSDDLNFTASSVNSITVMINNDSGRVNLTPASGFIGVRSLIFTAVDSFGLSAQSNNVTLNVTDARPPTITLNTPIDQFNTSSARQNFYFTLQDNFDASLQCNLTIDGVVVNSTLNATNGSDTVLSGNLSSDGRHLWNITCIDDQRNQNTSTALTVGRDTNAPTVNSVAPADTTALPTNSSSFSFNFTDAFSVVASCSLFVNDTNRSINTSVANFTLASFPSVTLADGNTTWYVNCTDPQGNSARSVTRSVRVPRDTANTSANFTANVTKSLAATTRSDINLSLRANVSGSVAVKEYSLNPSNVSTTAGNGFAALSVPIFLEINADSAVTSNLSWIFITIFYNDSDLPATVNESALRMYFFNESSAQWVQEPTGGVNTTNNFVFANVTHLSLFSVGGSAQVSGNGGGGGSSSAGGGGGGGRSQATSDISVDPSGSGESVSAALNQKIQVAYDGDTYSFRIVTLTSTLAGIRYLSTLENFYLLTRQSVEVDLDRDGTKDVEVIATAVSNTKATLLFREIAHAAARPVSSPVVPKQKEETVRAPAVAEDQLNQSVAPAAAAGGNVTRQNSSQETQEAAEEKPARASSIAKVFSGIFLKLLAGFVGFLALAALVLYIAQRHERFWLRKKDDQQRRREEIGERLEVEIKR